MFVPHEYRHYVATPRKMAVRKLRGHQHEPWPASQINRFLWEEPGSNPLGCQYFQGLGGKFEAGSACSTFGMCWLSRMQAAISLSPVLSFRAKTSARQVAVVGPIRVNVLRIRAIDF